jgi:PncC family amidohydrolase
VQNQIDTIAHEILQHAKAHGLTLCTAESCSAGRLATAFAKGDGAAQHFLGGIVAYTKEAKTRLLGVPAALLEERTAVCAEVAEAMALGAVKKTKATLGIAITGVTGASPDEDGNPVGLVYCAAARRDGSTRHCRLELGKKEPGVLIEEACAAALRFMRDFSFS